MRSSESPVGTRISDETATGKGRLMHCQPQSESQTPRQTSAGLQKIDGNFLKRARGGWGFFCREDMPRVFFSLSLNKNESFFLLEIEPFLRNCYFFGIIKLKPNLRQMAVKIILNILLCSENFITVSTSIHWFNWQG